MKPISLLTASLLGFALASAANIKFPQLTSTQLTASEREDLLLLRLVERYKQSIKQDNAEDRPLHLHHQSESKDYIPNVAVRGPEDEEAPLNPDPTPATAEPVTVLTPTGTAIVLASQGVTQTISVNASTARAGAGPTSTVVVIVKESSDSKKMEVTAHTIVMIAGGLLIALIYG